MIGSTLFFSYAIGKLVNGFIADHANVVRYEPRFIAQRRDEPDDGMTTNALLLAIFWGSTAGRSRWASALRGLAGALVRR